MAPSSRQGDRSLNEIASLPALEHTARTKSAVVLHRLKAMNECIWLSCCGFVILSMPLYESLAGDRRAKTIPVSRSCLVTCANQLFRPKPSRVVYDEENRAVQVAMIATNENRWIQTGL